MIKLINETSDMHKPYTGIARIEILLEDEINLDEMFEGLERFLSASGYYRLKPTSRLGCQIEITDELDGLRVSIPEE